jgi:flagellar basal-body rod modification protein FlgD
MNVNSSTFSPFSTFSAFGAADAAGTASSSGTAASSAVSTGSASPTDASSSPTTDTLNTDGTGGAYSLSSSDFMNLFLAQLQNQDPTQPVDDSQMLDELSQMTQVSTLQGVQTALQGSQLSETSALIGKNVTGVDVNGAAVDGVVTSVTQSTDAGLVLQVGSQYIKPDSITVVTAAPTTTTTTGS